MSPSSSLRPFLFTLRVCVVLVIVATMASSLPAQAQGELLPKDVSGLLDDVSDIDKLRILNPLKLTADELDKIITSVKATQDTYNKKIADGTASKMRELATEIKETRAKMLTSGGGVPKSFDDKMKQVESDLVARRKEADTAALKGLSDAIRTVLKADQIKTAVTLARKFNESDGRPTATGTDAQFFNYYVLGTFIVYPRIVPLLEDMKKAAGGSASILRTIARAPGRAP